MQDFIISLGPGVAVEEKGEKKKSASEVNRVGDAALSPTLVQSTARLAVLAKKKTPTHKVLSNLKC